MIYEYKDLKGIIKVGDRVRAVAGKQNACDELCVDGSDEGTITEVDDSSFCINRCRHWYEGNYYLDLDCTPSWERLRVGDIIVDGDGDEATVLAVLGNVLLPSYRNDPQVASSWYTIAEAQARGWTLKAPEEEVLEVTMADLEKKYGKKVKIKKE